MVTLYTDLAQTCDAYYLVPACHTCICPGLQVFVPTLLAPVGRNVLCDSSTLIDIATSTDGDPIVYFRTMLRVYSVDTIYRQRSIDPSQSAYLAETSTIALQMGLFTKNNNQTVRRPMSRKEKKGPSGRRQ